MRCPGVGGEWRKAGEGGANRLYDFRLRKEWADIFPGVFAGPFPIGDGSRGFSRRVEFPQRRVLPYLNPGHGYRDPFKAPVLSISERPCVPNPHHNHFPFYSSILSEISPNC